MASKYNLKLPRTHQEMALSVDPDHRELVRNKRKFRNLPDAYDDRHRKSKGRSWKNFRKSRYK